MALDILSYEIGKKSGGSGGTTNYNELSNKPSINDIELSGNKTTSDLGLFDGNYNNLTNKPTIPDIMQYSTIPTASADNLGKIVQYIGTTDSNYTNGYFYQCVSDGQDPATYSWQEIDVQDLSSKQDTLVSGTNIKTINNNSILGSGNLQVGGINIITTNTHAKDLAEGEYLVKYGVHINYDKNNNYIYSNSDSFMLFITQNENWVYFTAMGNWLTDNSRQNNDNVFRILYGTGSKTKSGSIKYLGIGTALESNNPSSSTTSEGIYLDTSNNYFRGTTLNYSDYVSNTHNPIISKGTLENVITSKELDLKQLSTYDATKTQVLKNINGTLTWVDET